MSEESVLPEPKSVQSVIGAVLFSADHPLTLDELHKTLRTQGTLDPSNLLASQFAQVTKRQIRDFLDDIAATLKHLDLGLRLYEENECFSLRTDPSAGPWVRTLLKVETPQRISRATLETLAIIAYRQPISRAEIESVRGVSADHTIRALMEMHLVRTVGRSELPGRPFLYGTTTSFLEHFGLKSLKELNTVFNPEAAGHEL